MKLFFKSTRSRQTLLTLPVRLLLLLTFVASQLFSAPVDIAYAQATFDFGDAPNSYNTNLASDGPRHIVVNDFYLGASIDSDVDGQPNTNADGDDLNGTPDDEDGIVLNPALGFPADVYAIIAQQENILQVEVHLPSGTTEAYLSAWIDLYQDGNFTTAGDQFLDDQVVTAGTNNISFNLNSRILHGETYMRIRLASQQGTADSPDGLSSDGEVEDYLVNVALPAPDSCGEGIINNSFEEPATTSATPFIDQWSGGIIKTYDETYVPGWQITPTQSGGTAQQRRAIELWRISQSSYEGDQYAEINAYLFAFLYQDIITIPGRTYSWQFAHRGRAGTDVVELRIGSPEATISQGQFADDNTAWGLYTGVYTVPAGQYITRFEYQAVSTAGGDNTVGNFLDLINFGVNCDYGDAPAGSTSVPAGVPNGYPVLTAGNGAAHVIDGQTFLGVTADAEDDGLPSADGNGDDDYGNDDEDGVSFTSTINSNDEFTLEVTAGGTGFLSGWIDFNRDGDWNDAGEMIINGQSLTAGANNLSITAPTITNPGPTFTRFRFSSSAISDPIGASDFTGEVEDYLINISALYNISGTVWDDSNDTNGGIDTGEPGIAGVTVVLVSDPTGTPTCQSVQTDTNGDYEFTDLPAGDYRVIEAADESVPTPGVCIPDGGDPTGYDVSSTVNVVDLTIVDEDLVQNFGDVQASGGTCGSEFAGHIRNNDEFEVIDIDTGEITAVHTFQETINVTGHNVLNHLVYAMVRDSNEAAVITPALTYIPLGSIAGLPDQKYVAGDVDANGHMTMLAEGSVHTTLYVVDFDPNSLTYLQMIHDYPLSSALNNVGDIALNAVDGNYYGYEFNDGTGEYELIQITPTGFVTRLGTLLDIEGNPITGGDVFGAVYFTSPDNRFYGYKNNPGLYMVDITDNGQPAFEPVGLELSELPVAADNDGFRCNFEPQVPLHDFGDAPDSYDTLEASNGPRHDLQQFAKIRMGTFVHQETDGIPGIDATGDDSDTGGDDEDGVVSLSTLRTTTTDYSVDVFVTNTTGRSANLVGWIDFNGDGEFEAVEGTNVAVGDGTRNSIATLNWTNLNNITAGDSYLRLRLTTDGNISSSTPGGSASNGEVEDYALQIRQAGANDEGWPDTGFAPDVVTILPNQPVEKVYQDMGGLWLEIPKLKTQSSIVGVSYLDDEWNVSWLSNKTGHLQGSAFPTWKGNTVLTAHNYLPNGKPGPFLELDNMEYGDHVMIHAWGKVYTYEVRTRELVDPEDTGLFNSSDYDIVTLVTCKDFDEEMNDYRHRVVVQAVLIGVALE